MTLIFTILYTNVDIISICSIYVFIYVCLKMLYLDISCLIIVCTFAHPNAYLSRLCIRCCLFRTNEWNCVLKFCANWNAFICIHTFICSDAKYCRLRTIYCIRCVDMLKMCEKAKLEYSVLICGLIIAHISCNIWIQIDLWYLNDITCIYNCTATKPSLKHIKANSFAA